MGVVKTKGRVRNGSAFSVRNLNTFCGSACPPGDIFVDAALILLVKILS
jgi:hypothetical protein